MFQTLRRRREDEQGFTLIELMVVVLIIAILLAIAIPTFLGAQQRAKDRAAQSNLRNAYTAAKTVFSDTQSWRGMSQTAATLANVNNAEPNITIQSGASTTKGTVSLVSSAAADTHDIVTFGIRSDTGKCYYVQEVVVANTGGNAAGTWYSAAAAPNASCDAAAPATNWQADSFPSV